LDVVCSASLQAAEAQPRSLLGINPNRAPTLVNPGTQSVPSPGVQSVPDPLRDSNTNVVKPGTPGSIGAVIAATPGLLAANSGPIRFDVRVELSQLLPAVDRFRVQCTVSGTDKGATVLGGLSHQVALVGGAYSGSVPVWLNYAAGQSDIARYPNARYWCQIITHNSAQNVEWSESVGGAVRPPSDEDADWKRRKAGAAYAGVISGAFPPSLSMALENLGTQGQPASQVRLDQQNIEQIKRAMLSQMQAQQQLQQQQQLAQQQQQQQQLQQQMQQQLQKQQEVQQQQQQQHQKSLQQQLEDFVKRTIDPSGVFPR
jgi:hypothetical protein